MHFTEAGSASRENTPVVFLHGNPASSHSWRNVLPAVGAGHLLAPDLIGMGRSGKPDLEFTFADHARYLDAWFDTVISDRPAVLVGHDWGGALAIDRAARHPDRVLGLAAFEAVLRPVRPEQLSGPARARRELILSEEGERMFLDTEDGIRQAFTFGVLTPVSSEDLKGYLLPYSSSASRRPLLAWARQLAAPPSEMTDRLEYAGRWLSASKTVPKLLLTFDGSPTLLIDEHAVAWARAQFSSVEIEHLGSAGHHAAEDRPLEIGRAVSRWLDRHGLR
jgi:haloalkane dehalogenase